MADENGNGHQISPMCAATAMLINHFKEHRADGSVFTDADLSAIAKKDVRPNSPGYANLQSAIRHMARQYSVIIIRIPKAGILKVASPTERVTVADSRRRRSQREARRGVRVLQTIDTSGLTGEAKEDAESLAKQLGLMTIIGDRGTQKRIAATKKSADFDPRRALDVLLS